MSETAEPTLRGATRQSNATANGAAPPEAEQATELALLTIRRFAALCKRSGGVQAVATVCALLAKVPTSATADLCACLPDLCREFDRNYALPGGPRLDSSAVSCQLPMSHAITLGVIAHLLICDAYVHYFPPSEGGRIAVSWMGLEAAYEITIEASGCVDRSATQTPAVGLTLARRLVRELGGCLETPRVIGGSRSVVTVPRNPLGSQARHSVGWKLQNVNDSRLMTSGVEPQSLQESFSSA